KTLSRWQNGLHNQGWNALFLENHDQARSVSTWGNDEEYHEQSAKSFATMYFLMQGTPFIYQGQEIGMTNVQFQSIEDYDDVAIKNMYYEALENGKTHEEVMEVIWTNGRDNSRTPMQWNSGRNAGFTTGKPWLKINPNYTTINVQQSLNNRQSIYHYYKRLIKIRKENEALIYGKYNLIAAEHEYVYAYIRTWNDETFIIVANLFDEMTTFTFPEQYHNRQAISILSNLDSKKEATKLLKIELKPYEAHVYQIV